MANAVSPRSLGIVRDSRTTEVVGVTLSGHPDALSLLIAAGVLPLEHNIVESAEGCEPVSG